MLICDDRVCHLMFVSMSAFCSSRNYKTHWYAKFQGDLNNKESFITVCDKWLFSITATTTRTFSKYPDSKTWITQPQEKAEDITVQGLGSLLNN